MTIKIIPLLLTKLAICDTITTKRVSAIKGTGSQSEKLRIDFPNDIFFEDNCVSSAKIKGMTIRYKKAARKGLNSIIESESPFPKCVKTIT